MSVLSASASRHFMGQERLSSVILITTKSGKKVESIDYNLNAVSDQAIRLYGLSIRLGLDKVERKRPAIL
jgi:hypothetical protein